jgi:hypothetical protein
MKEKNLDFVEKKRRIFLKKLLYRTPVVTVLGTLALTETLKSGNGYGSSNGNGNGNGYGNSSS